MIVEFTHEGLKRLFKTGDWSGVSAPDVPKVRRVLARLYRAKIPADMDVPGYHLAQARRLEGNYWSVTIGGPYLIVFRMEDGNAYGVNLSANF